MLRTSVGSVMLRGRCAATKLTRVPVNACGRHSCPGVRLCGNEVASMRFGLGRRMHLCNHQMRRQIGMGRCNIMQQMPALHNVRALLRTSATECRKKQAERCGVFGHARPGPALRPQHPHCCDAPPPERDAWSVSCWLPTSAPPACAEGLHKTVGSLRFGVCWRCAGLMPWYASASREAQIGPIGCT